MVIIGYQPYFVPQKDGKVKKNILKQWFSKVEKWSRKFFGSQHRAGHRNKDADRLSVVVVLQLLLGFGLEMTEPTFQPNVCHTLRLRRFLGGSSHHSAKSHRREFRQGASIPTDDSAHEIRACLGIAKIYRAPGSRWPNIMLHQHLWDQLREYST